MCFNELYIYNNGIDIPQQHLGTYHIDATVYIRHGSIGKVLLRGPLLDPGTGNGPCSR